MFIVLEGLDKQGKTTLANHLSQKFGIDIKKFSKPEGDPYIEYMSFLQNQEMPAILDRFYLGELVYGPVKRGKSGLEKWQVRSIEMTLAMRNPLCIYAFTSIDNTRANFVKEKEEYALDKDIEPLSAHFIRAIAQSQLNWHNYNYLEDSDFKKIDKIVEDWWNQTRHHLELIQKLIPARTLGNFFAETLLLGDISNIELEQPKYKDVNVGFTNGPSAELLYKSIDIENTAISNVHKAHAGERALFLSDEISLPNLKRVICLGNNAHDGFMRWYANQKDIKYILIEKAYHPAFILRGGISPTIYKEQLNRLML